MNHTPGTPGLVTRDHRRAVLVLFFVNGASFSSWLPRIPEVRDRLGLSLGELGLVLLGVGVGGLVASAMAGLVVDRIGSRRAAVAATITIGVGLPLIGLAPDAMLLGAALMALSAVDAFADIGMNVEAAEVQRRSSTSVVQRFHAAWSVGAVTGAASGTGAAAIGLGLTSQLALTGAVIVVGVLLTASKLPVVVDPPAVTSPQRRRTPVLVLLAGLALVVAVIEGTPGDWAAVFATDVHGSSEGVAGLGFVAVAGGMVVGRLAGDRATDRLGPTRLFDGALGLVAVGLAAVVASPAVAVAITGFALCGLGISVLFPALYLEAATMPDVPAGAGLGVMTTGARIGFLVSPAVTGTLSEATSLRWGLGLVIGAAAVGAGLLGRSLRSTSAEPTAWAD